MDISRKADCALRMLAMLADNEDGHGAPLSVRAAADEIGVPYSYARSIQFALAQAGIVESVRGVRGGMRLKADPAEVTLLQVVEAVQGPLFSEEGSKPEGDVPCADRYCYHSIWAGAQAVLNSYLDSVTVADAVHHVAAPAVDPMFTDRARFQEYAFGGECPTA